MALTLCSLAPALRGQQGSSPAGLPPGVELKIEARPRVATVGDPIRIDLDFALPQAYELQFPSLPAQMGEFTILQTYPGPVIPVAQQPGGGQSSPPAGAPVTKDAGVRHHQARIVVAVYKTGDFEFPALTFGLRDASGTAVQISSPVVQIRIESVLGAQDLNLKDLKKQADIAEGFPWLFWLAVGLAATLLALGAWWWLRRRRRSHPIPTVRPAADPLDLAEAQLRTLMGRNLLEKGLVKKFYVELSEIVKTALEAGYGIQTFEKTTSEIIDALSRSPGSGSLASEPETLELIETFLLSCDMVKFARYVPSHVENDAAVKRAFQIILACRTRRQSAMAGPAEVPGGA
jgi:hypothetical protein